MSPQIADHEAHIESILLDKGYFLLHLIQLFDCRNDNAIGGISISILHLCETIDLKCDEGKEGRNSFPCDTRRWQWGLFHLGNTLHALICGLERRDLRFNLSIF